MPETNKVKCHYCRTRDARQDDVLWEGGKIVISHPVCAECLCDFIETEESRREHTLMLVHELEAQR